MTLPTTLYRSSPCTDASSLWHPHIHLSTGNAGKQGNGGQSFTMEKLGLKLKPVDAVQDVYHFL